MKRALCVGINRFANYPQYTLHGCVNDARNMASMIRLTGVKSSDVTILTDANATKKNILGELSSMVDAAVKGQVSSLATSLSSHGTRMADLDGDEPDGMDEAFVPHDLASTVGGGWDPDHIITDDELYDLFVRVPSEVPFEVFLDTCHAGTGLRGVEHGPHAARSRYIAPPEHEDRLMSRRRRIAYGGAKKAIVEGGHVLWAACRPNETSADAYIGGRYNGAFTYYLTRYLPGAPSRTVALSKIRAAMKGKFAQTPQLEANAADRKGAIVW